jgi:acyl carrier protein
MPPRREWEEWEQTHGTGHVVSQKIRAVRELEGLGADVLLASADVADLAQMQKVVGEVVERFGEIDGVIHAAGVLDQQAFCPIRELRRDECWRQLAPKVRGLYVLEEVLRDRNVDFCVLTSSLSAILGGVGYAAYASGNAFMDAFAQQQSRLGRPEWRSVNWDSWRRAEDGEAERTRPGNELARFAMSRREGVATLGWLLALGETPQVVVSTGDLQQRIDRWVNPEVPDRATARQPSATRDRTRPELPTAHVAPQSGVERAVLETWQELLGIDDVGVDDNFFELGGTSLSAIQLMSQLKARLGVDVPVVTLYDAPTARLLATSIASRQVENGDAIVEEVERRVETRREGLRRRRATVRKDAIPEGMKGR